MSKKPELIIVDKERYQKYTNAGKAYFDGIMFAALNMIPKYENKWGDMAMDYAERFAFEATDTFLINVDAKVDEKIGVLKIEIDKTLESIKSSLANLATAPAAGSTTQGGM